MSGFPHMRTDPLKAMTSEVFNEWLKDWPESVRAHIALFGKPRVRVPVERQTPNEADL